MTVVSFLVAPFAEYDFMRRALVTAIILALSGAPLGVFLSLRRLTLVGDALAHALLPGVAVAFLIAGLSLWAMTVGGLVAAFCIGGLATLLTRHTQLKEDSAFAILYLLALATGVALMSIKGEAMDLLHLLFGDVLAIDNPSLALVSGVCCFSLFVMAALYRRFVIEGFDPDFLGMATPYRKITGWSQPVFFLLLMLNLVAAFQTLGTLMALGLMILPALTARFWVRNIDSIIPLAAVIAIVSSYLGFLLSFYVAVPSGPAITLVAGGFALLSAFVGRVGSVLSR